MDRTKIKDQFGQFGRRRNDGRMMTERLAGR